MTDEVLALLDFAAQCWWYGGAKEAIRERLGVQPLDLSDLSPEDQEYVLGLVERLRRQRGE